MKKYSVIYTDPPWLYGKGVLDGTFQDGGREPRKIIDEYPCMTLDDLKALDVQSISDKDCALFMWVTDSHLQQGLDLIKSWGFKYKTIVFIWKKVTNKGNLCANVGAWTMKNAEICLIATRGNMSKHKKRKNIFQLVEAERTKHSRKPDEVRKRIEQLFGDIPRIELFAREKHDGWDVWGNEVESDVSL
jgi:N6-adenosine-specific RNA methylase IME4